MKKVIAGMLLALLIVGCTPTSTNAKSDSLSGVLTPEGSYSSQIGGPSTIPSRGQSTMRYFVVPPLNFSDTPIKQALDTLFAKAGAKYVFEDQMVERMGSLSYSLNQKKMLDDILDELLTSRAIIFYIDSGNVYHVKANLIPLGGIK